MVIISGNGTESTPVNDDIEVLSIENGASVSIGSAVTIGEVVDVSQGSVCTLTVTAGNSLQSTTVGKNMLLQRN